MNYSTTNPFADASPLLKLAAVTVLLLLAGAAQAAVHGIAGPIFDLSAAAGNTTQPDGAAIYSWGYGCNVAPNPSSFLPSQDQATAICPQMQTPGPTMIVTEGDEVTVTLTNKLPLVAGNTSIVFPGFQVTSIGGVAGILTQEAINGGKVTYNFKAVKPGTYAYYSGTQPEMQIEMGMSGAIIVRPSAASLATAKCAPRKMGSGNSYSLSPAAYAHPDSCYDREYLFQFSELNSRIHDEVKAQVEASTCTVAGACPQLVATMEPYRPNYFMVNGRSMPDNMDVAYAAGYPNQPYNGNPHMHPGENVLMRVIGQGHWQHPFHFHGNHARVLARDANMLLSATGNKLAGPLLFTIPTVSGQTVDAIFTWTGQGLNWDVYGSQPHSCNGVAGPSAGFDPTTHEYCGDHGKPFPVTPPDPTIVVNGQWYAGTPYLGLQSVGNQTPEAPGTLNQNPQGGYAYMWHSHNEREITTNDVFPGGMMMMLLIDPYTSPITDIDETQ